MTRRRLGRRKPAVRTTDLIDGTKPQVSVYGACPAYDGKVWSHFAMSCLEAGHFLGQLGIGIDGCFLGNSPFLDVSRNTLVQKFLMESEATHFMFLDSDLRFPPDGLAKLLTSGFAVCAGVYPKRQDRMVFPVHYMEDDQNPGLTIVGDGWIPCDRVPTGFLCIERRVLEEMAADAPRHRVDTDKEHLGSVPWLFRVEYPEANDGSGERLIMGEDFQWCKDYVERYKEPIWVWPNMTFTHDRWTGNWYEFINEETKQIEAGELKPVRGEVSATEGSSSFDLARNILNSLRAA